MRVLSDSLGAAVRAAESAASTVNRAAAEHSPSLPELRTRNVESAVDAGRRHLQQLFTDAVETIAREVVPPKAPDAETIVATITENLATCAPSWKELDRITAVLTAIPESIPPSLTDLHSPAHDGEVCVIDAGAEPPKQPGGPAAGEDVIYYINGMMTPQNGAEAEALELSRRTGKPVVLVYSARTGLVSDVLLGAAQKLDPFGLVVPDRATAAQTELIYDAARSGRSQDFVAYSRGTIVTRNALIRAHARLYCETYWSRLQSGSSPVQAHRAALGRANRDMQNVHVITAASAAWTWPPYANVEHVSNVRDPIPNAFGQSVLADPREAFFELSGYDLEWLPTSDQHRMIEEPWGDTEGGIGHSLRQCYIEHVLDCL